MGAGVDRRRFSNQPRGLVKGSSTLRTGGLASSMARPMAPRTVRTRPRVGWVEVKSGQPNSIAVLMTNPWNR